MNYFSRPQTWWNHFTTTSSLTWHISVDVTFNYAFISSFFWDEISVLIATTPWCSCSIFLMKHQTAILVKTDSFAQVFLRGFFNTSGELLFAQNFLNELHHAQFLVSCYFGYILVKHIKISKELQIIVPQLQSAEL